MAAKTKTQVKAKRPVREKSKSAVQKKTVVEARSQTRRVTELKPATKIHVVNKISSPRVSSNGEERKYSPKGLRIPQFAYMKAPGLTHDFQVGDAVEVYCDHEKNKDRVRGWVGGIVVQVDNKMVAVQFRSNVFLTDGWMVPDRILWYPLTSEHIRQVVNKKAMKREKAIPEY